MLGVMSAGQLVIDLDQLGAAQYQASTLEARDNFAAKAAPDASGFTSTSVRSTAIKPQV